MKNVLATASFSRLIGTAILMSALLGALIGSASVAAAQERGDNRPTDDREQAFESPRNAENDRVDDDARGTTSDPDEVRDEANNDAPTPEEGEDAGNDDADDTQPSDSEQFDGATDTVDLESIFSSPAAGQSLAGQSLADYAALYGITEEELVTTLLEEVDAKLTFAVDSGYLTQEQAGEIMAAAGEHLQALVNQGASADDGHEHEDFSFEQFLAPEVIAELTGADVADAEALIHGELSLSEFAMSLGMTEEELALTFFAEVETQLTDAVANGELTEAQAEEILTALEAKAAELIGSGGEDHDGDEAALETPVSGATEEVFGSLESIAELTGTSVEEITAAVESGQTLAEFAAEHGVAETDPVAAVVAQVQVQVTDAVENGLMTQDEADMILANAEEFVTSIVNAPNLMEILETMVGDTTGDGSTLDECDPAPPNGTQGTPSAPNAVCPDGS